MEADLAAQASRTVSGNGLSPKFLFVIGAPRSGTTWIQKSLAEQTGWVTVPELHYAREVLRPVLRAWRWRAQDIDGTLADLERTGHQSRRLIGMPASLELDELTRALREPFDSLVARACAIYGRVDVFVEKSPGNSVLTPCISQVFPGAYMLHVLRDPHSAVRSLRSASRSEWGRGWAPRSVVVSALIWRAYVTGARRAGANASQYLEVKYEDARRWLPDEIARIRSWLGMPLSNAGSSDGVRPGGHEVVSSRITKVMGSDAVREPEGFGDGSGTRPELTQLQLWLVEVATAKLIEECGYPVRYRTARWANRALEAMASPVIARLSAARKESIALNLQRLRLFCWLRGRLRRHS